MKFILIDILDKIHKLVVYFSFLGFLLPKKYLIYHLFAYPLLRVHWKLNNNRCILTELEYKLKNMNNPPIYKEDHDYPYMQKLFKSYGFNFDNKQLHDITMNGLLLSWIITSIRLII